MPSLAYVKQQNWTIRDTTAQKQATSAASSATMQAKLAVHCAAGCRTYIEDHTQVTRKNLETAANP
jgi:hypothetical protein